MNYKIRRNYLKVHTFLIKKYGKKESLFKKIINKIKKLWKVK